MLLTLCSEEFGLLLKHVHSEQLKKLDYFKHLFLFTSGEQVKDPLCLQVKSEESRPNPGDVASLLFGISYAAA